MFSFAQQTEFIDFLTCKAELNISPIEKEVNGVVQYSFKVLKPVDSLYIDAKQMSFDRILINGRNVKHKVTAQKLICFKKMKVGQEYHITFEYKAHPKKAMYFIDWEFLNHPLANPQVWTQGQGKDNSNWIPSFDDMNEKVEFDLSITFDKNYKVIANGKLRSTSERDNTLTWRYDMQQPMSSYLLAIAIGKYAKQTEQSNSGIPLEMYYYPKDSLRVEPTYRYTKRMFDFLEKEIGVPYPWQNYKQVPVKDFLYAGMENTSTTLFSDAFVIDNTSFIDKNYVNVNAHELAHQWFGDLVTSTHGTHHWLHEGFATYYALLAEREVFGEDYYYHKLYVTVQQLIKAQEIDTIPLMNPKASSLTFYQKGAWALHSLREQVGDSVFKTSVKRYLKKHQFKNVETSDFITTIEEVNGQDLSEFVNKWLVSYELPIQDVMSSLENNENTAFLLTHQTNDYLSYRTDEDNNYVPSSVVHQLPENSHYTVQQVVLEELFTKPDYPTYKDLMREGIKSNQLKLRQVFADNFESIPVDYKSDFENLLNDASYYTIERALFGLWVTYPKDRLNYLQSTAHIIGFNDKNIRTLWLALALNTKGFESDMYYRFFNELVEYTNPVYHFEVRRNAFQYLSELQMVNSEVIKNLTDGAKHHNWRFKSYCKKLLQSIKP
ncbi:MAG: M1 family metallopeptidase [Flavobacteriaceae bacterium]